MEDTVFNGDNGKNILREIDLANFSGTENYYRHSIFKKFIYTDGVQYLAEQGEAYWLIDKIFGLQYENVNLPEQELQVWQLSVNVDKISNLTCHDGNYNWQHKEKINYTDFPLREIKLYLIDGVLLLTSEY